LSETPMAPPVVASGPSGPRASFGLRLVAALIDGAIVGGVELILAQAISPSIGYGVGLAGGLLYAGYLEGSPSGQTVGKKVMGIRVVDFANGGPIGFGRGVLRYLGKIVSSIPCGLGYLWMLWDKEKQTWHDKIATTVVVPVAQYPVAKWPG
jgi:uncharacterized RDD family membrane protein YckC